MTGWEKRRVGRCRRGVDNSSGRVIARRTSIVYPCRSRKVTRGQERYRIKEDKVTPHGSLIIGEHRRLPEIRTSKEKREDVVSGGG